MPVGKVSLRASSAQVLRFLHGSITNTMHEQPAAPLEHAPSASTRMISHDVVVGHDVTIYDFVNLYGCEIGDGTRIGTFVEIQRGVRVGARCKVQSHTFICTGVVIEDEVFVGHGVVFVNDAMPRATRPDGVPQAAEDWTLEPTRVRRRASIGSNATILGGITIGEGALVGAGSVVTHDVPPHTIVAGNPARVLRNVSDSIEDAHDQ